MMFKSLVALAILSVASAPVLAQSAPVTPSSPAKPQTVKKRVCEQVDEDPYSRLGNRKICRTIEVPVSSNGTPVAHQTPTPANPQGTNN
jgi:hypothetical protein